MAFNFNVCHRCLRDDSEYNHPLISADEPTKLNGLLVAYLLLWIADWLILLDEKWLYNLVFMFPSAKPHQVMGGGDLRLSPLCPCQLCPACS